MDPNDHDMYSDSEGDNDPVMGIPSPETKPTRGGAAPPSMGAPSSLGAPFGSVNSGLRKKVFSMADLAGAMETSGSMSPFGGLSAADTPKKAVKAKKKPPVDDPYDIGQDSDEEEESDEDEVMRPVLPHTAGAVPSARTGMGMRRIQSNLDMNIPGSPMNLLALAQKPKAKVVPPMLVVFDMDHTMVGDLVSLSDRDNIETNVPWNWWPPHANKGLSPDFIIPYLQRGMLRPGLLELLNHLRNLKATIVVYTHSEEKWAVKVCEAMERIAGWKFIRHIFSRMDCKDGHPEFQARKSLEHVRKELLRLYGMEWSLEDMIMFDDDGNALPKSEASRLVKVASYDYWEPCQWDEVVNEEMMKKNPDDLADMVRRSVVEWGIAPPSYGKATRSAEDAKRDGRWAVQFHQKRQILLSYNKVARLDRVMHDLEEAMQDTSNLELLPEKTRVLLGKSVQPQSRRRN